MMIHAPRAGLKHQKPHRVAGRTALLNGRRAGRALADRLLAQLAASAPDSILPVDFGQVRFMDFSCADELLTRVLRRIRSGELGTRFILVQALPPSVEENLAAVCAIRDLVCPQRTPGGKIALLGTIGPELAATYQLAVRQGRITAREVLATAPHVGISAISNRLAKLHTLGLLVRTREGGRQPGGGSLSTRPCAEFFLRHVSSCAVNTVNDEPSGRAGADDALVEVHREGRKP